MAAASFPFWDVVWEGEDEWWPGWGRRGESHEEVSSSGTPWLVDPVCCGHRCQWLCVRWVCVQLLLTPPVCGTLWRGGCQGHINRGQLDMGWVLRQLWNSMLIPCSELQAHAEALRTWVHPGGCLGEASVKLSWGSLLSLQGKGQLVVVVVCL